MPSILLIDDDPEMRSMIRRTLERSDYRVLEAEDGRAGLDLLAANAVDLVITDIIMPEMEGIELILRLRRDYPQLRIVAMSGGGRFAPEDYLQVAKVSGAARILAKPFTIDQLLTTLRELLAAPPPPARL